MSTIKILDNDLNSFYSQNPDFDILKFNLSDEAALSQLKWQDLDRVTNLDLLKKYQRLLRLRSDPTVATALLNPSPPQTGKLASASVGTQPTTLAVTATQPKPSLDSAHAIAAIPETQFVKDYGASVGGETVAKEIHQNATAVKAKTILLWANVQNMVASPHFRMMRANNVSEDIVQYFERLPSYQDIFGSLNYCECEDCKSIFSPAAYFVDLMRIIDRYITKPNQNKIPPGLKLEERRPDLAAIPLTCEKTNHLIPYLQIVNERLAELVGMELGLNKDTNPCSVLATQNYPFNLPFNLPLIQIRTYLAQLKTHLSDVYSAFSVNEKDLAREYLELSKEGYTLITTPYALDSKALGKCYGVDDLTQTEIDNKLKNVDEFLARTGLSLDELNQLFYQNLGQIEIEAKLCHQFFINRGLSNDDYLKVSSDSNRIDNLNIDALDRVNRFIRLAKKLNWSFTDLDWVLRSIAQDDNPTIDDSSATIMKIAKIKKIAEQYRVKLDIICSFRHDIKTIGLGDSESSQVLFDIIFNNPSVLDGKAPYHPDYQKNPLYKDTCLTWTVTDTATDQNLQNASKIAAGLKISLDDLVALGKAFFNTSNPINLSVQNLSVLYRHSQLAALLKLPINQYLILLYLLGKDKLNTLEVDDVDYIADVAAWLRNSHFNVYELDYVLNGNENIYVNKIYKDENIKPFLESLWTLIPSSRQQSDEERKEKLLGQLATFFGSTEDIVEVLIKSSSKLLKLPARVSDYVQVFLTKPQDPNNNPNLDYINKLIKALSRGLVLNQKLQLTKAEIDSVVSYPSSYGIENFNKGIDNIKASIDNIRDIYTFKQIIRAFDDNDDAFINYVKSVNDNASKSDQVKALIKVTTWDEQQVNQIYPNANDSNTNLVKLIVNLKEKFDLSQKLGVDISFLMRLCTLSNLEISEWQTYQDIANSVKTTVKAKYDDDNWSQVYSNMNRGIEEQKRNSLMAIALWKLGQTYPDIKTPRNLYEFLLIDGEMSGCAEISYIKEALNATQLYLQRCRLGLEQAANTNAIPNIWWEWIMNYRIWEANRKVFLYPENYLDPTLRSSKTTLFKELESQLLQSDITPESVEDAYRHYIEGFSQLAKLKYVDAYSCKVNDSLRGEIDTLFLFAHTQTEPYTYYYCTREDGVIWTEWQKIDLTIGSAYITPVYAFSKLFLFWVELKEKTDPQITSKDTGTQSNKNKFYNATVKFSFYDLSKKWIQPQTLYKDTVVYSLQDEYIKEITDNSNQFKNLFELDDLYWHKVYAFSVSPENYWQASKSVNQVEKITVIYGPFLEADASKKELNLSKGEPSNDKNNPEQSAFEENIYRSADHFNRVVKAKANGYIPLNLTVTINMNIQEDFLLNDSEFFLLEPTNSKNGLPTFKAQIDNLNNTLNIIDSNTVLYDNYFGDYTPEISDVNLTDPILFSNIAQRNVKVINVKNQPGWFIFDNGDEAFLLTPLTLEKEKVQFQTITDALSVRATPLLNKDSFSNAEGIGSENSPQVYNDLCQYKIIDQYGRLDKYFSVKTDLSFLFGGASEKDKKTLIGEVQNILLNLPTVQITDLITDKIDTLDKARQVYEDLRGNNTIDCNGRLDRSFSGKTDLSSLFAGESEEEKARLIKKVKDILLNLPVVTPLSYFDDVHTGVSKIQDYKFSMTRISTGAVHKLNQDLFTGGIHGLLSLQTQQIPVKLKMPFDRLKPGDQVMVPNAADGTPALDGTQVDFDGSYGIYFWEIFFHTPLLIGTGLAANQKFDDAQKWLQYIFNPTASENFIHEDTFNLETSNDINKDDSKKIYDELCARTLDGTDKTTNILDKNGRVNPDFNYQTNLSFLLESSLSTEKTSEVRNILLNYKIATPKSYYWQFKPFRNHGLQSLTDMLSDKNPAVKYWNDHPFDPHAIARLRIGAYEKAIVMKYIDSLLDWGDYMFAQDSWESITQATLLYVYAYDLLGPRPKSLGKCKSSEPATFENIREKYNQGDIPQFLIDLENLVPYSPSLAPQVNLAKVGQLFNDLDVYFCIPENEQFISYWDRVEDRLFKIRHCMNIEGIERQLALFQPPIDVMQLVRAATSGNNILNALTHEGQDIPHYRFQYMIDRAKNMTSTVIQLGASLLSALEKKDAEQIGILRSTQEENILNLMMLLKKKQIEEASETLDSLNKSLNGTKHRSEHFQNLIARGLSAHEQDSQNLMELALAFEIAATVSNFLASPTYAVPTIFGLADGGFSPGSIISAIATATSGIATTLNQSASLAAVMGEHDRRREEWVFQKQLADDDIAQIEKQIAAGQIRLEIAKQELAVHQKSIEQAKEIETFLKSKFSNQDLYQWMADRIATVYFQSYKIALDMALAAQKAYQYELNNDDTFITMQYWDSLRKGLFAGEGLMFALTQLEKAYIDNSSRHLEIEKTISLLQLNPQAFLNLKATGNCTFSLDEILFDYDFPGHYCRTIKSVSLSIPAIVGPYQNIKATFSQTYNAVVVNVDTAANAVNFLLNPTGDRPSGLRENWRPNQQIAISRGVDDSGMFVLNFNDERYLPFEGTGAISKWELKMPKETNRIDFEQLSDVIINLKYTAQYDGNLEKHVIDQLANKPYSGVIYLNLRQAFTSAWYNFMSSRNDQTHQKLTFQISTNTLSPNFKSVKLDSVYLKLDVSNEVIIQEKSEFMTLNIANSCSKSISLTQNLWTAQVNLPQDEFLGDRINWEIDVDLGKVRKAVDEKTTQDSGKLLKDGFLDSDHFQNIGIALVYQAYIFATSSQSS